MHKPGKIFKQEEDMEKNKNKPKKRRYILHKVFMVLTSILLVAAIAVTGAAVYLSDIINNYLAAPVVEASEDEVNEALENGKKVAEQIESEGCVLLKNDDSVLPLDESVKKVNVFGWSSTQWLGGGSGSGRVVSVDTDLLDALKNAGIEYNEELTKMYQDFQSTRPYADNMSGTLNSWPEQSCRLYEPDIANTDYYSEELLANAAAYSDTAIVVFSRFAGESNDCPQVQYKQTEKEGEIVTDDTRTYLDLSTEEESLLKYVGENYDKVIVLLNTGNVMTLGLIETIPGIDACLMTGLSGQDAANAIPDLLWGKVNPSGRTADTWAYDFKTAASYANSAAGGVGSYENAEGLYPMDGTNNGNLGEPFAYDQVSYVDYVEGIYVGYKWYETADAESYWDDVSNEYGTGYEGVVQYPFGYGLSYTQFDWEIVSAPQEGTVLGASDNLTVTVNVTNIGDTAGKDVVELYYTAPYEAGGIEKSAVELAAFGKTDLLEPGESEEVTLTFAVEDMASYDFSDANENGFSGYELDEGVYTLSVRKDAHTVADIDGAQISVNIADNIQYPTDSVTGAEVSNKFTGESAIDGVGIDGSDSEQNIVYMTRADFEGTFPSENTDSRQFPEKARALNLFTEELANEAGSDDATITTGEDNGLKIEENGELTELGYQLGADYNAPEWEDLLNQLTIDEMENLFLHAYVKTAELDSVGKSTVREVDGPSQVGSFNQSPTGTGFPNAGTVAQTWNADLAEGMGHAVGMEAGRLGYSGLYAPSVNMHRSPFNGRNYEYYSEDSLLSGIMCGSVVSGCKDMGIYCYVKHFICNDGESGIYRDSVYTWMTEQTLRQIYLRPFQIIVEDYGATGMMSSYNRIGAVWTGGSEALLTGVLRDEWGFTGAVITDYSDHHQYMNGDQALLASASALPSMLANKNGVFSE